MLNLLLKYFMVNILGNIHIWKKIFFNMGVPDLRHRSVPMA